MKIVKEYTYKKGTGPKEKKIFKRMGAGISDFFDGYGDLAKSFIKEADNSIHANTIPNFFIVIGFPVVFPLVMGGAVVAKLGYVASKPIRNIYDNHCQKKELKKHIKNGDKLYFTHAGIYLNPLEVCTETYKDVVAREVSKMNIIEKTEIVKKSEEEKQNIESFKTEEPDHGFQIVETFDVYEGEERRNYHHTGRKITLQDIHNVNKPKTYKYVRKDQ